MARKITRLAFLGLVVLFLGLGGFYACGGDPQPGTPFDGAADFQSVDATN